MMATLLLACLVGLMNAQHVYAAAKPHEKKHETKKRVEALEEKWRAAQLAGDVATMDKMLADDFIGISMSGQVNTKSQQLERVKSRNLVVTKLQLSDMKVKLLGKVAIVTSQADVEGTSERGSVKGIYRYTRIYQQMPTGDWKITSFEATRVRPHGSNADKKAGSAPSSSSGAKAVEPRFG